VKKSPTCPPHPHPVSSSATSNDTESGSALIVRTFFTFFFALQVLINSSLAFAHMAVDAQDPHEAVHVHTDVDHTDTAADTDHEDGAHFHFCAAALNTAFTNAPLALNSAATPFSSLRVTNSTSPPVPPPTA
jgi:hypothetical protein